MTLAAANMEKSADKTPPARVITPPIGLALTAVSPLAIKNSTHENMKQKNAVTAIPGAICGNNNRLK